MARVLVISFTDLARDARVDRQIGFLSERHDVTAAGLGRPAHDVPFVDLTPPPVGPARRAAGAARVLARRYEAVYWRNAGIRFALERLSQVPADLLLANDVATLPLAARVAGSRPVVLDAHEYAPEEQAHLRWWAAVMRPYIDHLVAAYLPGVAGMMTVSPGIADLYARRYGVRAAVVTNAPPAAALSPGPVGAPVRILHHGIADPSRHLDAVIDAVDRLDGRFTVDLRLVPGSARHLEALRRRAAASRWAHVVEPLAPRQLVEAANAYDIGVHLLADRQLNERLALPNKLFEFIQARLCLVVGPAPEMAHLVADRECGIVLDACTADALADGLRGLDAAAIAAFKRGSDAAAAELSAEHNRQIVLGVVDRALAADRAPR